MADLAPSRTVERPRSCISALCGAAEEALAAPQENSPAGVEDLVAPEEPVQQPEPAPPH